MHRERQKRVMCRLLGAFVPPLAELESPGGSVVVGGGTFEAALAQTMQESLFPLMSSLVLLLEAK